MRVIPGGWMNGGRWAGLLAALVGAPAYGQEAPPAAAEAEKIPEAAEKSAVSLTINLDLTTAYIYHGYVQEDTGVIFQPAALATINLYEKEKFSVDAEIGAWNSVHSRKTDSAREGDSIASWYECDLQGGVALTWDRFSVTTTYTFFTSPSDAFATQQELCVKLDYADEGWLGKGSLHPSAMVAFETSSHPLDGIDPGIYLELGIAPEFTFDVSKTPVTLTFPVAVGLSLHNYYQDEQGNDETFGFSSVGAKASVPLPISKRYGEWSAYAGVTVYFFGDHTAELNNGDHGKLVGTVGVQLDF